MRVFRSLGDLPHFRRPVVTVGSFDGVHSGHRAILGRVGQIAGESGGESIVVTFSPHPRQVLPRGGTLQLLNTVPEKIFLLDEAGIDNLIIMPFDEAFASTSWSDFIRGLASATGMQSLVVGYDHRFGRDQEGGFGALLELGSDAGGLGFAVEQIPCQSAGGHKVSSTEVRKAISAGDMALAAELMGRGYIMIADIDPEGVVTVRDALKLIPPAGRYEVAVEGRSATLSINADGTMRLDRWKAGEQELIEFRVSI